MNFRDLTDCCSNSMYSKVGIAQPGKPNSDPVHPGKILQKEKHTNISYIILWYDSPDYFVKKARISLRGCKFNNCEIFTNSSVIDRADVVVFHHNHLPEIPPRRKIGQIWILYSAESPFYIKPWYKTNEWRNMFNWSITYGKSSDFSMPYASIIKGMTTIERNYTAMFHKKTGLVAWVVSHCKAISGRDEYVRELRKFLPVDIYGKCGNLTCTRSGTTCLTQISEKYKFFLSFENSLCKDYVTEKVFSIFDQKYNIVPVIRGAPNIDEYVPRKTYLNAFNFETPKDLAYRIRRLGNNEQEYNSYLMEKHKYRPYYASFFRAMCSLCEKFNTYKHESILDTDMWFSIQEQCLVPQNGSMISYFDKVPDYWFWD